MRDVQFATSTFYCPVITDFDWVTVTYQTLTLRIGLTIPFGFPAVQYRTGRGGSSLELVSYSFCRIPPDSEHGLYLTCQRLIRQPIFRSGVVTTSICQVNSNVKMSRERLLIIG